MGILLADLCDAAQAVHNLNDSTTFSDAVITAASLDVIKDISLRRPLIKRANLAITDYTLDVDVSSLTIINPDRIEVFYPTYNSGYELVSRSYEKFGDFIKLSLNTVPTITSGTLTGTVTFATSSRSVTGASTLFTTELEEQDLICKSGATAYYKVAEITSATALVMEEPYATTGAADTVNLTKYRDSDSCVSLKYGTNYTVTTTSDMPSNFDEVLILGCVAYCAMGFIAGKLRTEQATAVTNLAAAVTNIAANSPGGDLATKYTRIAEVGAAGGRLTDSYKNWAMGKWNEYRNALNSIGKAYVIRPIDRTV